MQAELPSIAAPTAKPWRARWSSLRVKLFLAIAVTHMALVGAAYLIYSWSFDAELMDYLNRADEARLQPMIQRLSDGYRQHGSWSWLTGQPTLWNDLAREILGSGRGQRRPEPPSTTAGSNGAAPQGPPPNVESRLLLFNAQKELLLGPESRREQSVLKPIQVGTEVVGYLGHMPRLRVPASLEQVFQAEQTRVFASVCIGLLVAMIINAALISRWLARRLRVLGDGTATIARGDYSIRLPLDGHDELTHLALDFNRMAHALQTAQQARRQWIADIAHELRTPLATLRAEIEALQDGVRRPDAHNLSSLAQETARLTRLVDDLRMLSLSDLGALAYRFERVDLSALLQEFLDDRAQGNSDAALHLQSEIAPDVFVHGDADRLGQVFSNLWQNTLRYSNPPVTLQVRLRARGDEAVLEWEDSAPGVPEEALPRLTERLFRVDASRASDSGGSGLGLAIVHAIVQAHEGSLHAQASTLGGLRWELRFPLKPERTHG